MADHRGRRADVRGREDRGSVDLMGERVDPMGRGERVDPRGREDRSQTPAVGRADPRKRELSRTHGEAGQTTGTGR